MKRHLSLREAADRETEPYLDSPNFGARLSACLIYAYAYANLSISQIPQAKFTLEQLVTFLSAAGEQSPQFRAASAFMASTGAVLLHLPLPEEMPETRTFLPLLPPGLGHLPYMCRPTPSI